MSRKGLKSLFIKSALLLSTLCAPSFIQVSELQIFTEALVVGLALESPAYAAFEDSRFVSEDFYLEEGFKEIDGESLLADIEIVKPVFFKAKQEALSLSFKAMKISATQILAGMSVSSSKSAFVSSYAVEPLVERDQPSPPIYAQGSPTKSPSDTFEEPLADRAIDLWNKNLAVEIRTKSKIMISVGGPSFGGKKAPPSFIKRNRQRTDRGPERQVLSQAIVQGHIVMTGGLAFTGSNTFLTVTHRDYGVEIEEASIWPERAEFQIKINHHSGFLVAELRSEVGELLGQGEIDVEKLKIVKGQILKEAVNIEIKPVSHGLSGEVVSAYSFQSDKQLLPEAKVFVEPAGLKIELDKRARYKIEGERALSSYVVRGELKDHWGALSVAVAGSKNQTRMFSEKLMNAYLREVLDKYEISEVKKYAIVWGQVLSSGRPLPGAQVELSSTAKEPLYFNKFFPDKALKFTSENGYFMFLMVEQGVQSIRVKHMGKVSAAEVYPTEVGHVSYVNINVDESKKSQLHVFNAFSGEPLSFNYKVVGKESWSSGGESLFLSGGTGLIYCDIESKEGVEPLRVGINKKAINKNIPMVSSRWLERISVKKGLKLASDKGVIIGFLRSPLTRITVDGVSIKEANIDVVYFNESGNVVELEGGPVGFVLFNVNRGLKSVQTETQDESLESQVLIVEPEIVNLF